MTKNLHPPLSCHDAGACLQRPQRPCTGACDKARLRLAPGVVDGPYYPPLSRADRLARALLVLMGIATATAALVQLAWLAGWRGWL